MAIQATAPAASDLKALAEELGLPYHNSVEPNAELYDVPRICRIASIVKPSPCM